MIRITKFDAKKADELMKDLAAKIKATVHDLNHLNDYTIAWFEMLKQKYGARYPRKTEVRNFANINVKTVVEANEKLYINYTDGFVGTGLKKDEFLFNCSDLDDIIVFHKDGKYKILRVAEKVFIGTDILHIAIFKKDDVRTIYNVVYRDGKGGIYYMKRFHVTGVTRDKEYDLTQGKPGSKVIYFTANPNGEAEIIRVALKPQLHLKKVEVLKDLSELAVKNRNAMGNVLTKFEVKSITLKQKGHSTLGGRKVWFDPDVLRVNYDNQGTYIGEFNDEDRILVITTDGTYYLNNFDPTAHFDNNILRIEKWQPEKIWSLAMWNDELQFFYGKRFTLSDALAKPQSILGEAKEHRIVVLSDREEAVFQLRFVDENRPPLDVVMSEFIDVKSAKARGKRLSTYDISSIVDITPEPEPEPEPAEPVEPVESAESAEQSEHPEQSESSAPEQSKAEATTRIQGVPFTITNADSDSQLSLDL